MALTTGDEGDVRSDLIERARRGDREAFDVLMLDAIPRLFPIARMIAQDPDIAEDAVQESLVRCWRDLPTLRDPARFDSWLRRLLLNSVTEEFRKRRRYRAQVSILRIEPSVSDTSGALADRDELQRAFSALSVEHRTILVLHHYLGMSVSETAATLGIPSGTAKSRLHYANQALRATLDADARVKPTGKASA